MSTNPPEYLPELTDTQRLAHDITTATTNIRRDWPHMIRPGETQAPGRALSTGAELDDDSPSNADLNRITRTISLRRFTIDVLRAWANLVIDDRGTTHGIPEGLDAPQLCTFIERHADWLSGHDAAQEARDEIKDIAHRCHLVAFPPKRESISLGKCPLEQPGELDVLERCTGTVRYRLEQDERDGEAMAACDQCGEAAVITWWEDRMFDDPELQKTLDADGVCRLVHRTWGDVITRATVRQWVARGIIEPTETAEGRATKFDRDAVVYALDLHKRRQRVGS